MRIKKRSSRGIGLLELMLSLAVIAVLLVMATRFFGVTHRAEELNHAAKDVAFMLASLHQWQGGRADFQGVRFSALADQGMVSDDIGADGLLPPWGGCQAGHVSRDQ